MTAIGGLAPWANVSVPALTGGAKAPASAMPASDVEPAQVVAKQLPSISVVQLGAVAAGIGALGRNVAVMLV
jgi:hypothetical protein